MDLSFIDEKKKKNRNPFTNVPESIEIDFKGGEKVVSYSQYSKYSKCPYQWYSKWISKTLEDPPTIFLDYGSSLHSLFQDYIKKCYEDSIKSANEEEISDKFFKFLTDSYSENLDQYKKHYSSPEELRDFYKAGLESFSYFKKHRGEYFSPRKMDLVGIELPIKINVLPEFPKVFLVLYLDLVFYNPKTDRVLIIDIKTSQNGWKEYKKKDKGTTDQLVLYKKIFSIFFNWPEDKIDIEYWIIKKNLAINPFTDYPVPRISKFSPSSGKVSTNRCLNGVKDFIRESFNLDGSVKKVEEFPRVSGIGSENCRYCSFNQDQENCPKKERKSEYERIKNS